MEGEKKDKTSSICPSSCPIALKTVRSDDYHLLPLSQLLPPLCTFLGIALFIVICLPPSFSPLPSLIQRTPHSYDVSLMRSNWSKSHNTAAKHFQKPTKRRKEEGKGRYAFKKELSERADSSAWDQGRKAKTRKHLKGKTEIPKLG